MRFIEVSVIDCPAASWGMDAAGGASVFSFTGASPPLDHSAQFPP